mgnify:CR=1 FL=1
MQPENFLGLKSVFRRVIAIVLRSSSTPRLIVAVMFWIFIDTGASPGVTGATMQTCDKSVWYGVRVGLGMAIVEGMVEGMVVKTALVLEEEEEEEEEELEPPTFEPPAPGGALGMTS